MKNLMKRFLLACLLTIGLLGAQWPGAAYAQTTTANVLVLYDAPPNDQYTKLGFAYSIMLRNLLGHFNTNVTLAPVSSYTAGNVENYQATFYLGSYFDNAIPPAFLADVTTTSKTVVWFKYNLWQVAWDASYGFTARYGFTFAGLRGLSTAPTSSNPTPDFFDTVTYKNQNMVKYYAFDASTGVVSADPDIGVTTVSDATKASALVTMPGMATMLQHSSATMQLHTSAAMAEPLFAGAWGTPGGPYGWPCGPYGWPCGPYAPTSSHPGVPPWP